MIRQERVGATDRVRRGVRRYAASASCRRRCATSAGRLAPSAATRLPSSSTKRARKSSPPPSISTAVALRTPDELEPESRTVRPEERRLPRLRLQVEDATCYRSRLRCSARPVAEASGHVAARVDRDARDGARDELGRGLDADPDQCDVAADLAPVRESSGSNASRRVRAEPRHAGAHAHLDAVRAVAVGEQPPEGRAERPLERGRERLEHRHACAERSRGRRDLGAHEAAADHDQVRSRHDRPAERPGVLDRAQYVDAARHRERKPAGTGTRREHEDVPAELAPRVSVTALRSRGIDVDDTLPEPEDDLLLGPGRLRAEEELVLLLPAREVLLGQRGPLVRGSCSSPTSVTAPS